jgi:hypothetical protein
MGIDDPEWGHLSAQDLDLIKSVGANTVRIGIYMDWWTSNLEHWEFPGTFYQQKLIKIGQWAKERGLQLIIQTVGTTWDPQPSWSQMEADAIMNTGGAGDQWISVYGDMIRQIQPWGIDVMNEPPIVQDTTYNATMTQNQFFAAYRQFCTRAIEAWRATKPDLVIIINSMPFWDLHPIVANPVPGTDYLAIHYYYSYDNTQPPSYDLPSVAYWQGNLTSAKTLLSSTLLNNEGVQVAIDAGFKVLWEEMGTRINNPNALVFLQDAYDFANINNIGVLHHNFRPASIYGTGILNDDWATLNAMGEVWKLNMPGV